MKEYFHHNYGCHHRTVQSCDCSRDNCSSNSCCCSHGGHQDKYAVNLKKGSKFMLEKAFYRALMEDQVERIKDIILDDDELDEALEKTANLIVKVMKKQWREDVSKSELSEELDRELEKILRKREKKEESDDEVEESDDEVEESNEDDENGEEDDENGEEDDEDEKQI
jgi:hypothetical protein